MPETPVVSVCCLSYNHADFISQCLDGILMQETTFPIEILIHDDASTDGTEDIIKQYTALHPDIIFPLYETENRYSNGYKGKMDIVFNYPRARGKYIAYCECDDYWTDPHKLQKQVDFMESHPDYSVCFHRCQHLNSKTGRLSSDNCRGLFKEGEEGIDITMEMFFEKWITQPLTMLFRKEMFNYQWHDKYKYYRDMHEIFHLLKAGKGYLFSFVGGIYRYHSGGINSMISTADYCTTSLPIDKEFYHVNPSKLTKNNYLYTLQECINYYSKKDKWKAFKYLFTFFNLSFDFTATVKFLSQILSKKK